MLVAGLAPDIWNLTSDTWHLTPGFRHLPGAKGRLTFMGSFLLDILEFIILALFVKAMTRSLGSLFGSSRIKIRTSAVRPADASSAAPHRGEMVRDPVCGMFVSTELSQRLGRGAQTLHFCSRECLEKYQKDAEHAAC
jgi:YHS domain-containing protein